MSGEFLRMVAALREQMNATLTRSDVLRPLHFLLLLVGGITATALWVRAPEWALIALFLGLGAAVLAEIVAYFFCLFVDRDALRSERYSLEKMAIEHHLLGDSSAGTFEEAIVTGPPGSRVGSRSPKRLEQK